MLIQNLNMQKTGWDGAEDRTINNFHTIDNNFEYDLKSAHRPKPTAVFHIKRIRQKYSLATRMVHQQRIFQFTCNPYMYHVICRDTSENYVSGK